jgi:hypothetical protein
MMTSNAQDTDDVNGQDLWTVRGMLMLPVALTFALLGCEAFADPSRGFLARLIETLAVLADHGPVK